MFQVEEDSASLRMGPGTGNAVAGYAFEDEELAVLASHEEGWYQVSSSAGDLWIAGSTGELSGDCSGWLCRMISSR
jgi:uncharacterized protein YgiM (DUF1202 family)